MNLQQATSELRRISTLVEQGIRPAQELDAARTAVSTAREALNAATSAAGAADFYIEEIRSTLLKGVTHSIPLRSPVDGVVLRIVQQSERIVSAGTPVAEIGEYLFIANSWPGAGSGATVRGARVILSWPFSAPAEPRRSQKTVRREIFLGTGQSKPLARHLCAMPRV